MTREGGVTGATRGNTEAAGDQGGPGPRRVRMWSIFPSWNISPKTSVKIGKLPGTRGFHLASTLEPLGSTLTPSLRCLEPLGSTPTARLEPLGSTSISGFHPAHVVNQAKPMAFSGLVVNGCSVAPFARTRPGRMGRGGHLSPPFPTFSATGLSLDVRTAPLRVHSAFPRGPLGMFLDVFRCFGMLLPLALWVPRGRTRVLERSFLGLILPFDGDIVP